VSAPDTLMSPRARQGERSAAMRDIVTPEGVPIGFELAGTGDRAAAFLLDVVIQAAILIAIALVFGYAGMSSELLKPILIILEFLIQNFYFAFFEIRWQGQTPGKRKIGIRVIDARGGQLDTGAVLARNLVRELEVWTPLRFLILNRMMWPDAPGWALLIAGAWTFVFLLMPLFNKDKLRVGDLVGGTRVVRQPKIVLLPDLVREAQVSMQRRAVVQPSFTFSDEQLAIYGIYELQVLEDVLRQDQSKMGYYDSVSVVCDKIREKIGYVGRIESSERFLKDFYVALRAHLESKMLFGQRKADKFSK
jgi:uncharacterized RDD family membrane protein YckC